MKSMITRMSMFREDDNLIYGKSVTEICIDDEGGGMFIVVKQHPDTGPQEIRLDLDEIDDFIKNLQYMKNVIGE